MTVRRVGMDLPPLEIGTPVPSYGRIIGMTVQRTDPGNGTTILERRYFLQKGTTDVSMLPDDVVRTALAIQRPNHGADK